MSKQVTEVDAIVELKDPSDIHVVFKDITNNGYVSHESQGQNVLIVNTENGVIGVQSENPTFIFGLIVNIHNIKREEILKRMD